MRWKIAMLMLALLSGVPALAKKPVLETPSGRPEVFIAGATKKKILDPLVRTALSGGGHIVRQNDYELVIGKRDERLRAMIFGGSTYDPYPENRAVFTFIEEPGGVRLFLTEQIVTNPGSPFERITTLDLKKSLLSHQQILENIREGILAGMSNEPSGTSQPAPAIEQEGQSEEKRAALMSFAAQGECSILLESTPMNAEVYLDGNFVGTTPFRVSKATPGAHQVALKKPGYQDWTKDLTVMDGAKTQLSVQLVPLGN